MRRYSIGGQYYYVDVYCSIYTCSAGQIYSTGEHYHYVGVLYLYRRQKIQYWCTVLLCSCTVSQEARLSVLGESTTTYIVVLVLYLYEYIDNRQEIKYYWTVPLHNCTVSIQQARDTLLVDSTTM